MVRLRVNFWNGINGLPESKRKAYELFQRAVDLSSKDACVMLATFHREGLGDAPVNLAKAVHYDTLGIKRGNYKSRFNMAVYNILEGQLRLGYKHFLVCAATRRQ